MTSKKNLASLSAKEYLKYEEEREALSLELSGLTPATSPQALAALAEMQAALDADPDPDDDDETD